MKTRVAIWAAVSSKPQAADDKTSLQDQENLGRQYAEKIGGEVVRIYKVPGHTRDIVFWHEAEAEMPAYRQLREDIAAQNFDILWVLDPDRLGRDPALSNQVVSLIEKAGAQLHLSSGDYSIGEDSSAHRYLFAIQAVRAGEDQKKRRQYHEFGMRARIKRGLPSSNWPHGYEPIRSAAGKVVGGRFRVGEIEAVQLATELFLDGQGFHSIAIVLNESPYMPRKAGRWRYSTVRAMMNNDTYAGLVAHGGTQTTEPSNKFPALWDEETYRAILRERDRRHRGGSSPASPVSGIVICAQCGCHMVSLMYTRVAHPYRIFRCRTHVNKRVTGKGCHSNQIKESVIIAVLEDALRELAKPGSLEVALESAQPARSVLIEAVEQAQTHVETIKEKQYRLAVLAEDQILDVDAVARRTAELAKQLQAADKILTGATQQLMALPDYDSRRASLAEALALPDLHSRPMDVTRGILHRAGLRVLVRNRQIERIEF